MSSGTNAATGPLHMASCSVISDLLDCLSDLSASEYSMCSQQLSGASIGQHTRHILELYGELLAGYETGSVNYDERKRNRMIETDLSFAIACLKSLLLSIDLPNRQLVLEAGLGGDQLIRIGSDYERELLYNLEHTIHHMALIGIAVRELTALELPSAFGVAPGTIQYRNSLCAQ